MKQQTSVHAPSVNLKLGFFLITKKILYVATIDSINNYFQISTCKKKSIVQKKGLYFCFKLLDTSFTLASKAKILFFNPLLFK